MFVLCVYYAGLQTIFPDETISILTTCGTIIYPQPSLQNGFVNRHRLRLCPTLATQVIMEPFFNNEFNLSKIEETWKSRKEELSKDECEDCADMLLKFVYNHVIARRAEIMESLQHAATLAKSKYDLRTTIWSYNSIYFNVYNPVAYRYERRCARMEGYDYTIATPDGTRYRSVSEVIRRTDFCARVSLIFGPDFSVHVERGRAYLPTTDVWSTSENNLVLCYHPGGHMSLQTRDRKDRAYALHGYKLRPEEPILYTGIPQETPGFSNVTPPRPPPRDDPPPLRRVGANAGAGYDTVFDDLPSVRRTDSPPNYGLAHNWATTCYCNCDNESHH